MFTVSLDMLVHIRHQLAHVWVWKCEIGQDTCKDDHPARTRKQAVQDAVEHLNHRHNIFAFAVETGGAR